MKGVRFGGQWRRCANICSRIEQQARVPTTHEAKKPGKHTVIRVKRAKVRKLEENEQ